MCRSKICRVTVNQINEVLGFLDPLETCEVQFVSAHDNDFAGWYIVRFKEEQVFDEDSMPGFIIHETDSLFGKLVDLIPD